MFPQAKPNTNVQWGAIQNGANNDSLINQLYAGGSKTAFGGTVPKAQTPPAVAASSQVKNTNAPFTGFNISSPLANTSSSGSTTQMVKPSLPIPQMSNVAQQYPQASGFNFQNSAPSNQPPINYGLLNMNPQQSVSQQNTYSGGTTGTSGGGSGGNSSSNNPAVTGTYSDDKGNTYDKATGKLLSSGGGSNSGASGTQNNAQQFQSNNDLYGNITSTLANTATGGSAQGQQYTSQTGTEAGKAFDTGSTQEQGAYDQAQQYQKDLEQSQLNEAGAIAGINGQPIPLEFQQGQARVLQDEYTQQQAAIGSALQGESNLANTGATVQGQGITGSSAAAGAANTAQGQVLSGLANAGNLAAPIQVPYSNQLVNPVTASSGGGTTQGQLPAQAQSFVNNLAEQVKNGQMTRDEATSQLQAYGPAGLQALNSALGSSFNTNASNASAATTATGQQLQTQATAANSALDTLSQLYQTLGMGTGATGFKPLNSIEQSIAGLLGNANVGQYQTTLQEARAKVSGVLAASGGVTPTTADEMAKSYLPDGMTPQELPAKIQAAKTLIQQSVSAFTQSGQQNKGQQNSQPGNTTTSGGSVFSY